MQRYLHGEIPPNSAAGAVATLMAQPDDALMQQVAVWSAEQSRLQAVPVSELLLHALKKVYITGELNLLDREAVANYLDRATTVALRMCPAEERDNLRLKVMQMRMSRDVTAGMPVGAPAGAKMVVPTAAVPAVLDEEAHTAKRLSLILDRMTSQAPGAVPMAQADPQQMAQILAMAANTSKSGQQFNQYFDQIRSLAGTREGNVFVILGGGVPQWDLPSSLPGSQPPPAPIGAMEKIIEFAEDTTAATQRFRELVIAAIGKFNEGSLAATVWMLDVAHDTITEKKLDKAAVERICTEAADAMNQVQLRKYTESRSRHAALRLVLEFFPTMRLPSLFSQLRGEPRPEKRRSILGTIEAWTTAGREMALTELESELDRPDVDTYYLRNAIYLLHRIARDSEEGMEREVVALTRVTERGHNIYVLKEAATALGQIRTDAAVKLLITRLAETEAMLLRSDASLYPIAEMQKFLDRITTSLGRIGTSAALLAIARHGMKANPLLGDTRARLAVLAHHDLAFDEDTVDVLLKALRDDIPGKFLGRILPKKQEQTIRLIEALSGTRSDEVEEVFKDVAERFPDQEIGRAAAEALQKRGIEAQPQRAGAATLSGELEFFGLPSILQSLADMRATGMLTLTNRTGQPVAKVVTVDGKFVNAQNGPARGFDALYATLERPMSGSFAFVPHPPERLKSNIPPEEILPLLLEGVRRHDELQRIIAFVPDDMVLDKTNTKPSPPEEEKDPAFIREVWLKAAAGTPVSEWERELATDPYRVRRLVAHWLEQGALVRKQT
jgi:hypothetical protein